MSKLVPNLRFPEFNDSGEWVEKKLGEVFYSEKGKGLSKDLITDSGIYECILYGELYTKYQEVIHDIFSKTNVLDGIKSKEGDLLIPSSTTTNGYDLANVTALNKSDVLLGGDITVLRAFEKINNIFYAYYLSNNKKKEISGYAQGSTIVHLYFSHIKEMKITSPSLPEQTKIATFLSSIDERIEALTEQLELTRDYKKGMMQRIFSQEYRFKDDEGNEYPEWENQFLDSIANITMGSSPKSSAYNEVSTGLPLIQGNADINKRLSSPRIYTSEITKECFEGDILLSVRAPVGEVSRSVHHACIGRGVAAIRAKKKMNNDFLYQFLLWFEPRWASVSQGSTFEAVNSKDIKELVIVFPCIEEQTKIATFLTSIDERIEALSEQLEQTKLFKKAMLQRVLV